MARASAAAAATTTSTEDSAATPRPEGAKLDAAGVKQIITEARPPLVALLQQEIWAREAGIKFNTWEAVPPAGTPWEHIENPAFWANVSRRMKMGDKIIVVPRDGAFYGELVVWDAGQNWAHVSGSCQEKPAFGNAPGVDDQFQIAADPIDGFVVKRKASGAVLKKNLPNAEEARRWIIDHQQALRS